MELDEETGEQAGAKPDMRDSAVRSLASDEISKIAKLTIGQSENPKWHEFRRNRITGSMFGRVLSAVHSSSPSAIRDIRLAMKGELDLSYLEPIKWGKAHEVDAIAAYCRQTGRIVKPTGIWLFPNGMLGASPDGLVFEKVDDERPSGILEVKCPFSVRDLHHRQMREQKRLPRYLTRNLQLNPKHEYYHQVQGELVATQAPWCDFAMWTPRSILIQRIFPNANWAAENIPKLTDFYNKQIKVCITLLKIYKIFIFNL